MTRMEIEARRRLTRRMAALGKLLGDGQPEISEGDEGLERRIDQARRASRLSDREAREFTEILEALRRIHDGDYGLCCECGRPMGRLRLLAVPEVRLCLDCEGALVAHARP